MRGLFHRDVDRVVLMHEGRIISDCSPDELLSGPLLIENGIREPLYITALKYAGVDITPEMQPHSIRTVVLEEDTKRKMRDWFRAVAPAPPQGVLPELLEIRDLSFTYPNGFHALKDISVSIRRGELTAIVGTNGAGKSTFAKVVCGFERQQQGSVTLAGQDMTALSIKERADHIGYVMQNPNQMISKVQIFDEVALGLRTRGVSEEEIRKALIRSDRAFSSAAPAGSSLPGRHSASSSSGSAVRPPPRLRARRSLSRVRAKLRVIFPR